MTMASKKTLAGILMWMACGAAWAEAPTLNPDHDYAFEWRESGYTFTDLNDNKVIAQGKSGARYRQNTVMVWTGAHDEACKNNKVIIWAGFHPTAGMTPKAQREAGYPRYPRDVIIVDPLTGKWETRKVPEQLKDPYREYGEDMPVGFWTNDLAYFIWELGNKYDPCQDVWSPVKSIAKDEDEVMEQWAATVYERAMWTGEYLFFWQGKFMVPREGEDNYVPALAYLAKTDNWSGYHSVDEYYGTKKPPQRILDKSVFWTGKELVVWGYRSQEDGGGIWGDRCCFIQNHDFYIRTQAPVLDTIDYATWNNTTIAKLMLVGTQKGESQKVITFCCDTHFKWATIKLPQCQQVYEEDETIKCYDNQKKEVHSYKPPPCDRVNNNRSPTLNCWVDNGPNKPRSKYPYDPMAAEVITTPMPEKPAILVAQDHREKYSVSTPQVQRLYIPAKFVPMIQKIQTGK